MRFLVKLEGDNFEIDEVVKKERKRNPAPPFTTSSFNRKLPEIKFPCKENNDACTATLRRY